MLELVGHHPFGLCRVIEAEVMVIVGALVFGLALLVICPGESVVVGYVWVGVSNCWEVVVVGVVAELVVVSKLVEALELVVVLEALEVVAFLAGYGQIVVGGGLILGPRVFGVAG